MCLCLIVIGAQPALCFSVVWLIGARSVFVFHFLLSVKRTLFFFSFYVSNKRVIYFVFQRGQLAVFLLEIPISCNCSSVRWLKCLQFLNCCLIRAHSIFWLIVQFEISAWSVLCLTVALLISPGSVFDWYRYVTDTGFYRSTKLVNNFLHHPGKLTIFTSRSNKVCSRPASFSGSEPWIAGLSC